VTTSTAQFVHIALHGQGGVESAYVNALAYQGVFFLSDPASPQVPAPVDPTQGESLGRGLDAADAQVLAETLIGAVNALVIALDSEGEVIEFNRAAETVTGYSRSELVGRNWFEVVCPPDRYPEVWEEFARLGGGGMPHTFENPILTKSGEERFILWSNAERSGDHGAIRTVSVGIDVTDQRLADRAHAETLALLGSIVECAPSAIFAKDLDGNYTLMNTLAAEFLGKPKEELLGRTDAELFPPELARVFVEGDRRVAETGDTFSYNEEDAPDADGAWQYRLVTKGPVLDQSGQLAGVFGITSDLTDSVFAEKAIAKAARENEQLARAAMALVGCQREDEVFEVVAEFFAEVVRGSFVVVNEMTADGEHLMTRCVLGADQSVLMTAAKAVGFEIVGRRFAITEKYRREFFSATLMRVPGGFSDLTADEIPRAVTATLEKALGLHDMYTIGITNDGSEFGSIHILTRAPDVEMPEGIIDAFVRQCVLALAAIERAREISETVERQRRLFESMSEGLALQEMVLGQDGAPIDYRLMQVNPAFETIVRLKASDVVGHLASEVLPASALLIERFGAVASTGVPDSVEIEERDRVFRVNAYSPGDNQFAALISDITDSKRSEQNLAEYREQLEGLLAERDQNVKSLALALSSVIDVLSRTVEMRDPYTAGHQRRVSALAEKMAIRLGMQEQQIDDIRVAGLMHDVGKVSIPAEILSKPGRLTGPEFELAKYHALAGYEIVQAANMPRPIAEIIYQHHERCDGSGYPQGLLAEDLHPGAKVLMVADIVEAMASHRPYRPAIGLDEAIAEIEQGRGVLYDRETVDACVAVIKDGFEFEPE
jgi:PAS domain S-box-containing protein/putative nucleotidyltransferase with HDIG domain